MEFFGDPLSKTEFAKDLPNMICITVGVKYKAKYPKSELKNVFQIMGKRLVLMNTNIGSPYLHCYGSGIFLFFACRYIPECTLTSH